MKKILYSLFVFSLVFSSCKKQKDLPEPDITQPEFYVNCSLDGSPLRIEAGNDNYYMNSSWYHQDSNNIYVYKGNFKKKVGNGYEITILINDDNETPVNGEMNVDKALRLGEHLYNDKNIAGETQVVNFSPLNGGDDQNYSWTVFDGANTPEPGQIVKNFSPVFKVGTTYSVALKYDDGAGVCSTTHTNVFKAGSKLQTTVNVKRRTDLPELQYELSCTLPGYSSSFSYKWEFGDNSTSTKPGMVKLFLPGTYRVKLTLTDENTGEACVSYYQLNAIDRNVCEANYVAEFMPIKNTRIFSSVVVLITDPNGVVYSSQGLLQPQSSKFELLEVEPYNLNENQQPTKRLKVKFNCVVKNGNKEINVNDGEAVIAVAHK